MNINEEGKYNVSMIRKFLKPEFEACKITHELSRETLILIMSTSVQTKIRI